MTNIDEYISTAISCPDSENEDESEDDKTDDGPEDEKQDDQEDEEQEAGEQKGGVIYDEEFYLIKRPVERNKRPPGRDQKVSNGD
ncbi:hypothetical protein G6F70_009108 [Rhizopus microsporus]|nr:hypothetical protein G6F71_009070 [Rhizopus microsporus]KAG1193170.1 hypothetical protein G6F70_009108 [Rhizopus microsporus]KAG1206094.1 hypothetical protein G6F69_009080 [Rhizopus microsporus]KAG1226176.1 hypothetical protein G6F67_009084 [Rhizopus microsporus]KAG1257647.1 hypothetical protein G6F68_009205 [Rhizopus microsporus]